jgi:hypothetical protein
MDKLIRCYRYAIVPISVQPLWRSRKPLGQRENIGTLSALRYAEHEIP